MYVSLLVGRVEEWVVRKYGARKSDMSDMSETHRVHQFTVVHAF
jgi:hypothetical protein